LIVFKIALAGAGLYAFAWLLNRALAGIALMSLLDGWN
jgi:hypothetical protein